VLIKNPQIKIPTNIGMKDETINHINEQRSKRV
jgi:hypothetical protein